MSRLNRCYFFFQAEDGIRDLVRSRGLGDVYKRQGYVVPTLIVGLLVVVVSAAGFGLAMFGRRPLPQLSLIHI